MNATTTTPLTGRRRAAIVLLALGPELSSEVLRHLSPTEVEELVLEVLQIGTISEAQANEIIEEFHRDALARDYLAIGGPDYARAMLINALGEEKAHDVLTRVTERARPRPFDFLRHSDPAHLMTFLQEENPQTIALVLAHLPHNLAATVLKALPVDVGSEVALRLTAMDRTPPDIISAVESTLQHRMGGLFTSDYSRVGGPEFMARVLSQADRTTEKAVLSVLDERNSELATEVRRLLFTFENIEMLDDQSLQRVLREVDFNDLPIALKNTPAELLERVCRNLSSRSAEILREEVALLGPVRTRQINEAQQRIVAVVRRLEEQEVIFIEREGEESIA